MLVEHGALPAFVHTSLQHRTIRTADLALSAADRDWIPVRRSWRLNGPALRGAAGPEQGPGTPAVRRTAIPALAPLVRRRPAAAHRGGLATPAGRSPLRHASAEGAAARRIAARRFRAAAAVLVRRDRAGPAGRRLRTRRLARQHAAGPSQAPGVHSGRPDRRDGHPHRHPAAIRARAGPAPGRPGRPVPRPARHSHQEDLMNAVPRIVVGVDGFESSKAALRWAIHQAKLTGAVVDAVTTWHIPPGSGLVPAVDMPDYQDDARIILTEAITEMCTIDTEVVVRPRVVEGQAGPVLVEAAEGADLLVVGNRGHGGLAEALLGSVGQYCVRHAPCPVVIMRGKPAAGA